MWFPAAGTVWAQDVDGDGLRDDWEVAGYDADHDGIVDEPLHRWGADPHRKDVFVEIDWMAEENVSAPPFSL